MNFLKQYWLILAVFILLTLLVLIRTFSQSNFRYDAVKWAEPSAMGTNIVTEDQISSHGDEILLINLGHDTADNIRVQDKTMKMNPESILEKSNLTLIRKNKGPVVLYSADNSVSARIWMILSEMGIKNIYILQDDHLNNE
ncbi:MAG: rhodanese-like domain-containing protein [Bacteroidales bacterium]|nr:rhodanese-like domain-containing protein [Bacteroidales bacterium]